MNPTECAPVAFQLADNFLPPYHLADEQGIPEPVETTWFMSLYLHIPFCVRRCHYCDFYVLELGSGPPSQRLLNYRSLKHRAFLKAMSEELKALPKGYRPRTVYVGGGTPTELPPNDLRHLFQLIENHIDLSRLEEFTCEANPGTMDEQMAKLIFESGVDRVSLGVQSFDDDTLESLGRIHNADEAMVAFHMLRDAGLTNISLDLLFALPGAGMEVIEKNLAAIAELRPDHVSWYSLEFEAGTMFTEMRDRGTLQEPDSEQAAAEYKHIRAGLRKLGYRQYELFSFTRPGYECKHNLNYWKGGPFFGCGPSAHSHQFGIRWSNPADLTTWTQAWLHGAAPACEQDILPPEAKARERLMTELRLTAGVSAKAFHEATGFDPVRLIPPETLADWIASGKLLHKGDTLKLDPSAYLISDSLFRELVSSL